MPTDTPTDEALRAARACMDVFGFDLVNTQKSFARGIDLAACIPELLALEKAARSIDQLSEFYGPLFESVEIPEEIPDEGCVSVPVEDWIQLDALLCRLIAGVGDARRALNAAREKRDG